VLRQARTIGLVFGSISLLLPVSALAADETIRDYFERMDSHYAEFFGQWPITTSTRGTGFKPYMRYKWFTEPRLEADGNMRPGSRWRAFQELQTMVSEQGRVGNTWFTLGPTNVAGRCLAIEVDPTNTNIVYAGFASGGIWKTTDSGLNWTPLDDFLPTLSISAIEIDQNNPNRIWIATGEGWNNIDAVHGVGLMVSEDAGASWQMTGLSYDLSEGRDQFEIEHNPATGTLIVAQENGLFRSTDDGDTWTTVSPGSWRDVELQKGSTTRMFACRRSFGFYVSEDDGATWTLVTSGTPTTGLGNMRFGLTAADPNVIYWAIDGASSMLGIWKSTNGGTSFSQVYSPGTSHYGSQGWYDLTIDVDPEDPNRVWSGGIELWRSTNGGTSFTQIASNVHVDHHATFWDPNDANRLWVGTDGGVYLSQNAGTSFFSRNNALITLQYYAMNHSVTLPTRAVGGTQDNGTWVYNDSQLHTSVLGGDGFECEIDYENEQTVYAELYFGDHYRSDTGGSFMDQINSGITEQGPWETPTHMDFSDPHTLFTAHNSNIYRTTNRGDLWVDLNATFTGSPTSIHQCRDVPDVVVLATTNGVFVSTNHGDTWVDRTSGLATASSIQDVYCHPTDPNTIVLALATYNPAIPQVIKTTDQGLTWTGIDGNLPDEPANSIVIDPSNPDRYFVGTDLAVYVTFSAGTEWFPVNVGLPHVVIDDLRLHDSARFLRVGTHGRGMWELDITDLVPPVAVGPTSPEIQPLTLRAIGNPIESLATLRFAVREAGKIHLGLYDVSGRLLRTIAEGDAPATVDNVTVDVSDLAPGIYYARLDANGATASAKLVVAR